MIHEDLITLAEDGALWTGTGIPEGGTQITAIVDDDGTYWTRMAAAKAMLTERVRARVASHITAHAPLEAQQNMTAAATRLYALEAPGPEDLDNLAALNDVHAWIVSVRQTGQAIRTAIEAASTAAELNVANDSLPTPPSEAQMTLAMAL